MCKSLKKQKVIDICILSTRYRFWFCILHNMKSLLGMLINKLSILLPEMGLNNMRVAGYELQVASCELWVVSWNMQVGKCELILQVASWKVWVTSHQCGTSKMLIPGGTDLERGYGDVRPWRHPFHASPAARKDPISSKRVSSLDPLLRKFGNFSLCSLNFHPNFSSQAPKFGNFQLTSPQIWKFSAHKPPNLEIFHSQGPLFRGKCQFTSPYFGNPGCTPLPEKRLSAPPGADLL